MKQRKLRVFFASIFLFAAAIAIVPALAEISIPYASVPMAGPTAAPAIVSLSGQSSCYFQEVQASGKVPGPVDVYGSNDYANFSTPVQILDSLGSSHSQPFTPTNKVNYGLDLPGLGWLEVVPDATWNASTQSAQTTVRCSPSFPSEALLGLLSSALGSTLQCSGLATCSPAGPPTPSVYVPSPSPTATGCATLSISWPTIAIDSTACSSGGGGGSMPTPSAAPTSNPTPVPGFLQMTGGLYVGPAPSPAATDEPKALQYASFGCSELASLGSGGHQSIAGVTGELLTGYCNGTAKFTVTSNGEFGLANSLAAEGSLFALSSAGTVSDCPSGVIGGGNIFSCNGGNNQGALNLGGTTDHCALEYSGLFTGNWIFSQCPMQSTALSNSTTTEGFLPPVYTNAGAATGSTLHGSQFACTFSSATSCALGASYWTGAAVFVTIQSCSTSTTGTDGAVFQVGNKSTATATIYSSISTSDAVTGICWGT